MIFLLLRPALYRISALNFTLFRSSCKNLLLIYLYSSCFPSHLFHCFSFILQTVLLLLLLLLFFVIIVKMMLLFFAILSLYSAWFFFHLHLIGGLCWLNCYVYCYCCQFYIVFWRSGVNYYTFFKREKKMICNTIAFETMLWHTQQHYRLITHT